jgi:arginine decarboxylase
VTNGTSTSNKIIHQALLTPGDIVLIDRDCHKSHHYGIVLAGAQPLYIDAFPLTQYSMYGSLAIRPIKEALLQLKAEGKLDRAKMLVLTNCTFDGHVANVERTMLECLAIKPDLDLPVGRGLVRLRALLAVPARPHRDGRRGEARAHVRDPATASATKTQGEFGSSSRRTAPLDRAAARPGQGARARLRERLGAQVDVALRQARSSSSPTRTSEGRGAFKELSSRTPRPSPNQQIIASLDWPRRPDGARRASSSCSA